jgi:sugar (pentulose or hexulose) kinase
MNVTVSTELTRTLLGIDLGGLNEKATSAPIGSEGIILLPYFNGERTPPLPNASASFFGLTSVNYTPENLCRASMEGATLGLRYGLEVLKHQGIYPTEIRLVGGGASSSLWRKMVADIFNCTAVCPQSFEAGSMGAALQAMWCDLTEREGGVSLRELSDHYIAMEESSRANPDKSNVSFYDEVYSKYLALNDVMAPLHQDH